MAKTNSKPGPKPGATTRYGKRRDYHILLSIDDGLADAFEQVAREHNGIVAYTEKIIRERPEIKRIIQSSLT